MIKAIFYKEWLKTRWYYILANILTLSFTIYSIVKINRVIRVKGAQHVWEVMLQRDAIFVDLLQYIPLLIGILMAVVQFVPEMNNKSLKLTLHLPNSALGMVAVMLASGVAMLLLCFGINMGILSFALQSSFATELQANILMTALVWYIAGITAYILIAWVCLEPTWKMRVLNLIITAFTLKIFFMSPTPQAYNGFIVWLILYTIAILSLPWLSVSRFKVGKQD